MPQITKLSTQKRAGYYNVFVDDAFLCGIAESDLVRLGLRKGQEIDASGIEALQEVSAQGKHYNAALRFLSYRIRSEHELRQYFQRKKLDSEEIQPVLDQLKRQNYIDDRNFAERWVAMRSEEGKAMRAIQAELIKKGISRQLIEEFCVANQDEELAQAIVLVEKKRRLGKDDRLIHQFLARRGFSYTTTRKALSDNPDND